MKTDQNNNGMTYASHTLPSLHLFTPHHPGPTQYPQADLPIHSSSMQSTKFHHNIHNHTSANNYTTQTQQFKVHVRLDCSGKLHSHHNNNQKTLKQYFSQTNRNQSPTRHHPTHPDHHHCLLKFHVNKAHYNASSICDIMH